jgi:AraC-like DNA-binding protein
MLYDSGMDWKTLLREIRRHMTLDEIAKECGFASRGHVHDLANGHQLSVEWSRGQALIKLHKRVSRRK